MIIVSGADGGVSGVSGASDVRCGSASVRSCASATRGKTTSSGSVGTSLQNQQRKQTCALRWTRQRSVQASGRSGVSSRSCWRGRGLKVESLTRRSSPTVFSSTSTRWEEVTVLFDGTSQHWNLKYTKSFPLSILMLVDSLRLLLKMEAQMLTGRPPPPDPL